MISIVQLIGLFSLSRCTSLNELLCKLNNETGLQQACFPTNCKDNICDIEIPKCTLQFVDCFCRIASKFVRSCTPFESRKGWFREKCETRGVNNYVKLTLGYIKKNVGKKVFCKIEKRALEILKCIDQHLKGSPKEFALFTASALHNTSYLQYFEEKTYGKLYHNYKSRGLLMIRNEDNYKKLQGITKNEPSYLLEPEMLAKPNCEQVYNTIKFWKKIMHNKLMCFDVMLEVLNPVWKYEYDCCGNKVDYSEQEKARKKIFDDLEKLYCK